MFCLFVMFTFMLLTKCISFCICISVMSHSLDLYELFVLSRILPLYDPALQIVCSLRLLCQSYSTALYPLVKCISVLPFCYIQEVDSLLPLMFYIGTKNGFTSFCLVSERKISDDEFPHNLYIQNYSTATATCLCIHRWIFNPHREVGGCGNLCSLHQKWCY